MADQIQIISQILCTACSKTPQTFRNALEVFKNAKLVYCKTDFTWNTAAITKALKGYSEAHICLPTPLPHPYPTPTLLHSLLFKERSNQTNLTQSKQCFDMQKRLEETVALAQGMWGPLLNCLTLLCISVEKPECVCECVSFLNIS